MGSLFGKKSSQSSQATSSNQAYRDISKWADPLMGYAQQGASGMASLLGGDTTGFDAYKGATGFDAAAESGSRGVTGNAAARGLLRSGSTAKGLQSFGNDLQNQYADKYMNQMSNLAGFGYNAANTLSGAGQVSQSTSKGKSSDKSGLGQALGSAASMVAMSDIRSKKQIKRLGELRNGLGVYSFRYKHDDTDEHIGVMAQEVARIQPEALGPITDGYMTVDYSKLEI